MSFYCEKHGATDDCCSDCLDQFVDVMRRLVKDHAVYEEMLGYTETVAIKDAKRLLEDY
jgi:hypothetical protein